jgi:hypothetical protein
MVLGIGARILPMFAAVHAIVGAYKGRELPAPAAGDLSPAFPHDMPVRAVQAAMFVLWSAGVPVVAGAFYFQTSAALRVGAWLLLAAAVLSAVNMGVVARHAFRRSGSHGPAAGTASAQVDSPRAATPLIDNEHKARRGRA